jgi:hypothetical protein
MAECLKTSPSAPDLAGEELTAFIYEHLTVEDAPEQIQEAWQRLSRHCPEFAPQAKHKI